MVRENRHPTSFEHSAWNPVGNMANAPQKDVELRDGLFKRAFDNNTSYLLQSFTVNDMLYHFRLRAGQQNPPHDQPAKGFWGWEGELEGSCAGRFMMGAGKTLRWVEHAELRKMLDDLVNGIEACREANGYMMAFSPESLMVHERANYTRSWVTRGMIEAGFAGNSKAFALIRDFQDWFNTSPYISKVSTLRLGYQGMIANTCLYFTPVGKPEDIVAVMQYYQQDWWLERLARRDEEAVWKYPNDGYHGYETNPFVAYLDMYRATGDQKYLEAVQGAWELFHTKWMHVGGSVAICEEVGAFAYPPASFYIYPGNHTGETCNSAFWILLNQRLHHLYPDQEVYVSEIEKAIYNVLLANQDGDKGIRYHTHLHGEKEAAQCVNTCCEGTATLIYGSLPQFIYSIANDGLYVNLFEASRIECKLAGQNVGFAMTSTFPRDPSVSIALSLSSPARFKLRIRVPSWACGDVPIRVNGCEAVVGQPGSYATLDREWADGDSVDLLLPIEARLVHYKGLHNVPGYDRYAIMYGPFLMAVAGPLEEFPGVATTRDSAEQKKTFNDRSYNVVIRHEAGEMHNWLEPRQGDPLHFTIAGDPHHEVTPYYAVSADQVFSCYPIIASSGLVLADSGAPAEEAIDITACARNGRGLVLDLGNVKMELVAIEAGQFAMGTAPDQGEDDERPLHQAKITKPFFIGRYEVTQAQWEAVMGTNPSRFPNPQNPVENVSWEGCQVFLARLNERYSGRGLRFSLPTEAQWEYACRAGVQRTLFYNSDYLSTVDGYMWHQFNANAQTHPVGQKWPNGWGLCDMLGNVGEWCSDWYDPRYYQVSAGSDPAGPERGEMRTVRGGFWGNISLYCRCGSRFAFPPTSRSAQVGFRVICQIAEGQ